MTRKHHIPSSIKTFVERHTDDENHEKLKKTHKDMEEKKNRLLSYMEKQQEIDVWKDESKRGTITELIEEFHKEYESLYTHYDALTEELKRKVQRKETPKEEFSSSSDSDSDSDHSSKGKGLKNGELENGIRSATEATRKELEAATLEVADLKNRLAVISNDKIVEDLKAEAERLNQEKLELLAENVQLKQELDTKVIEQVDKLTQEKNMLQAERSQLESQMDEEKRAFCERLSQMENDNKELKIKVKTLTEELSMRAEPKDDIVAKLERTIEGLRKEADKAVEKARTFEAQLRLANQKVRVTDQLLNEDEETHKIALRKYEEKCKSLEERIAANNKAYGKMIITISNKLLAGMEFVAEKFEDDHGKFTNKLTIMSEDIHILKHFTSKKSTEREQKDEKNDMDEKISKLEVQMQKQKEEKEEKQRAVSQLKKEMEELNMALREKDEQLSTLGEEKRQAIRQLCLWWDDTKNRYDNLKNVVSKAASETHQRR